MLDQDKMLLLRYSPQSLLMQARVYKLVVLTCILLLLSWLRCVQWYLHDSRFSSGFDVDFPKKIWQILDYAPEQKPVFIDRYREQWKYVNPQYRYECLAGDTEDAFVHKAFRKDKGILRTYESIKYDPILRADFLRYLILLAEGGVYTDVDTRPLQPIEDWIPRAYRNKTNVVLGVEIDKGQGKLWRDVPWTVQISQFTIMAKPYHPLIRQVVDYVIKNLKQFLEQRLADEPVPLFFDDVIGLTGPRVFTSAVFQYLSEHTGLNMTGDEVSRLREPVLIADVLFLPANGFASGQLHSNSGTSNDDGALVAHRWMSSWVPSHPHQAADNSYIS